VVEIFAFLEVNKNDRFSKVSLNQLSGKYRKL
jgi:hypothetical protein